MRKPHAVGRSGQRYSRAEVIAYLPAEQSATVTHSRAFELRALMPSVCLVTYQSAELGQDGCYTRHSLRSSIWCLDGTDWQLLFHQGTPAAAPFSWA